jgi:pyrroline-5-carboxylate reductase
MKAALTANIAFIGGGNMAQALIGGLLAQGLPATRVTVSEPVAAIRDVLADKGVQLTDDNLAAIEQADIVVLAVKPQVIASVLQPLAGKIKNQLVISIAAGVNVATLSALLNGHERIVRAMPNTPALIQAGATGLFANPVVGDQDRIQAAKVLGAAGLVIWVDEEKKLDAVTAVSGSGPAYFFYLMEAMIQAGKDLGLDERTATTLTLQTALGAAQMAVTSEQGPTQLRKNVTSPSGTTQAAIETLDAHQVSLFIQQALAAASKRSEELAAAFTQPSAT